jgi:hypothetical protein
MKGKSYKMVEQIFRKCILFKGYKASIWLSSGTDSSLIKQYIFELYNKYKWFCEDYYKDSNSVLRIYFINGSELILIKKPNEKQRGHRFNSVLVDENLGQDFINIIIRPCLREWHRKWLSEKFWIKPKLYCDFDANE